MFEPFTVITALTVTAATFGVISILSDYCLSYYKLRQRQKTSKLQFFMCPQYHVTKCQFLHLNKRYYAHLISPHYVDMSQLPI